MTKAVEVLQSFTTSVTTDQLARHDIPEDISQEHCYENLKSCIFLISLNLGTILKYSNYIHHTDKFIWFYLSLEHLHSASDSNFIFLKVIN